MGKKPISFEWCQEVVRKASKISEAKSTHRNEPDSKELKESLSSLLSGFILCKYIWTGSVYSWVLVFCIRLSNKAPFIRKSS